MHVGNLSKNWNIIITVFISTIIATEFRPKKEDQIPELVGRGVNLGNTRKKTFSFFREVFPKIRETRHRDVLGPGFRLVLLQFRRMRRYSALTPSLRRAANLQSWKNKLILNQSSKIGLILNQSCKNGFILKMSSKNGFIFKKSCKNWFILKQSSKNGFILKKSCKNGFILNQSCKMGLF